MPVSNSKIADRNPERRGKAASGAPPAVAPQSPRDHRDPEQIQSQVSTEAPQMAAFSADLEPPPLPPEVGGPRGPEPTRYGDWEKGGRCIDF